MIDEERRWRTFWWGSGQVMRHTSKSHLLNCPKLLFVIRNKDENLYGMVLQLASLWMRQSSSCNLCFTRNDECSSELGTYEDHRKWVLLETHGIDIQPRWMWWEMLGLWNSKTWTAMRKSCGNLRKFIASYPHNMLWKSRRRLGFWKMPSPWDPGKRLLPNF